MSDLPSIADIATGGIVGGVILASSWLVNWFRSAAADGETLADRRIASLMADFEAHRKRSIETQEAFSTELTALQGELATARAQLRKCRQESHDTLMRLDALASEVAQLKGQMPDPPTGDD